MSPSQQLDLVLGHLCLYERKLAGESQVPWVSSIRPGGLIAHTEEASSISQLPILCSRRSLSSSAAPRGAFNCLTWDSGYSPLHGMTPFAHSLRPFSLSSTALSFLPAIHAWRSSYVCSTSVAGAIGRSTLWQDRSPGQTNPPPRRIVLCPPDPYRAKELPGDP